MKTIHFAFEAADGTNICVTKWTPEDGAQLKGAVQIAHGMAEHIGRYEGFAKALVDAGYVVYGNDHRGHGRTAASPNDIGYFADVDGWKLVVEDMHQLTNIIKKENPNLSVFLFGHSMGSFLSRTYIQMYGKDVKGVVLSGTGGDPGLLGNIGIAIAKSEVKRYGGRARSIRLDKLSFGGFNKIFRPNRTKFDWLSRDNSVVDKYIGDPLCGEVFTAGFFRDMLTGLKNLNKRENIAKVPKELPIIFISGEKDPVGKNTKGVLQAYHSYRKAGIQDVSHKFYADARHEVLNETNREEVYSDIIDWLDGHC